MSTPSSKQSQAKSRGRKQRVEPAKDAVAQQNSTLPKRRRARMDAARYNLTTYNNPGQGPTVSNVNNNDTSPATSETPPSTAMFGGNATISGGTFVQNNMSGDRLGFKLLQKRVAPSAFHNSIQRVDPPRCHPDTRVAIMQKIYNWITHPQNRKELLFWLNGAAGAGKSAIMQSIAERCAQAAIAIASFFFFRADSTRNTMSRLIATLAYQLVQVIPETRDDIISTIEQNPLIFDQSIESQLQQLLIQPLLRLPAHIRRLFVVFIDGLDECDDRGHQSELIKVLGNVSRSNDIPIKFIIASRREPQIEAEFVDKQLSELQQTLPLDNSDIEQTSDDIRRFVTNKFNNIKDTHLRRHLLPNDWPPVSAVDGIVTKSSGQFIFASVVVKYVSSPRANPAHQLDVIRGLRLRDPSSQNPFAYLDALYHYIFSQIENLDKVLDILAYVLVTKDDSICQLENIFQLERGELEIYFADLTAVIECDPLAGPKLKFLHASLPDFLYDKCRSERYHIDYFDYTTKLLCTLLDRVPLQSDIMDCPINFEYYRLEGISRLLQHWVRESDRQLQCSLMNFSYMHYKNQSQGLDILPMIGILKHLKQWDFRDQCQIYHHVLEMFAVRLAENWQLVSCHKKSIMMKEDLYNRITQLLERK